MLGGCKSEKETKEGLRVGFQAQTMGHAPAQVIYQTQALDNLKLAQKPLIKDLPGGTTIIDAIASGDINIVYGGWGFVVPAIKGLPVKIVAGIASGGNFLVCMPEGINKIADLKGKTIAVHGQMSSQATVLRLALKEAGLNPQKDVNIVVIDRPLQIIALTEKKSVDCIVVGEPVVSKAVKAGAYIAVDNKEMFMDNQFPETWVFARTDIIQNNHEDVNKLLEKHSDIVIMLNENSMEAAETLAEYFTAYGINETKGNILKQMKTYNYNNKIDKETIENSIKTLYEQGIIEKSISIDELVDCSFGYCK